MNSYSYRCCIVKGKDTNINAIFHRWVDVSEIVSPSPMVGGHTGGVVKGTFALIEYEDGTIHRIYPEKIIFCDNKAREILQKQKE